MSWRQPKPVPGPRTSAREDIKRSVLSARELLLDPWRNVVEEKLRREPLCEDCLMVEKTTPATGVIHVYARHVGSQLVLPTDDLLAACARHYQQRRKLQAPSHRDTQAPRPRHAH